MDSSNISNKGDDSSVTVAAEGCVIGGRLRRYKRNECLRPKSMVDAPETHPVNISGNSNSALRRDNRNVGDTRATRTAAWVMNTDAREAIDECSEKNSRVEVQKSIAEDSIKGSVDEMTGGQAAQPNNMHTRRKSIRRIQGIADLRGGQTERR